MTKEQVHSVLTEVRREAAAHAALLISGDGVVISSVGDAQADLDALAAYTASSVMVSERLGESASFGRPETVMVVYRGRAVVMSPVGPAVAVLIGAASQTGALRLTLMRYLDDLTAAVKGKAPSRSTASETKISEGDDPLGDEDVSTIRINPGLV